MHNGSSVGIYTQRVQIFARLAPNSTLSWHLLTIIIVVFFCDIHLHVHYGIKSPTLLALDDEIGTLLPFRSLIGNLARGPLSVGKKRKREDAAFVRLGHLIAPPFSYLSSSVLATC